jgi:hypothetical protein
LKQIIKINDEQTQKIHEIEEACETICRKLEQKYQKEFQRMNQHLVIELIRKKKGKPAVASDILEIDYESFIEIGIEHDEEYFPNAYIPIWKCKGEWFQKIGYLTKKTQEQLSTMVLSLVKEMIAYKE